MLFYSQQFLIFFAVVFGLYWALPWIAFLFSFDESNDGSQILLFRRLHMLGVLPALQSWNQRLGCRRALYSFSMRCHE